MSTAVLPAFDELLTEVDDATELDLQDQRLVLRASLFEFLKWCWPLIEPETPLAETKHLKIMCGLLEKIEKTRYSTKDLRWLFNVPPGTLKSILISVVFPAWVWARNGARRFLCASYGQQLSTRDNVRCRDIIESSQFQMLFPMKLAEDQNAKTRYNTSQGGWRVATSVGGIGTGEHPDYILIDDPQTALQVESEQERQTVNSWFDRTIALRGVGRHCVVIVIQQRLHVEDLSGYLARRGDVKHVYFPMRFEPTRPATDGDAGYQACEFDYRTEKGELLVPEIFPEETVKKLERDLGAYGTAGQLQQVPVPEGGGMFKRAWFKFLDARPAPSRIRRSARGWDTAATEQAGDWTVGVRIDEFDDGNFLISDVVRDQLSPAGVDGLMLATAQLDGKIVPQREEKEGGASGKTVVDARAKTLVGFDYQGVGVGTSKILRSKPFRSQAEAGNIYLLRASWNEEYIKELCDFPVGKHDDQVDASSCSFNSVLLEPRKRRISAAW